eukprot:scaffold22035_cov57-Attheya_sp.AAC.2
MMGRRHAYYSGMVFLQTMLICLATTASDRIPALTFLEFDRNRCELGRFLEIPQIDAQTTSFESVARDLEATKCVGGIGIRSIQSSKRSSALNPLMVSTNTSAALLRHFSAATRTGITFELWMKPTKSSEHDLARTPIFTLGKLPNDSVVSGDQCTDYYDFQLRQIGDFLDFGYRTSDPFIQCRNIRIVEVPLAEDELVHLVISLTDGNQNVYINGEPFVYNYLLKYPLSSSLDNWNPDFGLQFFSDEYIRTREVSSSIAHSWKGTMYLFAIYDRLISTSEAKQSFLAGLNQSYTIPTAIDFDFYLNEDAEVTENSHAPVWYEQPRNVSEGYIPNISLSIESLQTDIESLLALHNSSTEPEPPILNVYIREIPAHGVLFQEDLTAITHNETLVSSEANRVIYLPEKDAYSTNHKVYDTFSYYVTTEDDSNGTHSYRFGMVSIFVQPMNDPPIPMNNTYVKIPSGFNHSTPIFFKGEDKDEADFVSGARITSFPLYGDLYHIHRDGSYGARVVNITIIEGTLYEYPKVGYIFLGPELPVQPDGVVGTDYFSFTLQDSFGAESVQSTVEIEITSSVTAIASFPYVTEEDTQEPSIIPLFASDNSGLKRKIQFEILTIPKHGEIFDPLNSTFPLSPGMTLKTLDTFPYKNGVSVEYKSNTNYFNWPPLKVRSQPNMDSSFDSFDFRVAVFDSDSQLDESLKVLSRSVTQEIVVINVNDKPVLVMPQEEQTIVQFSSFSWNDESCRVHTDRMNKTLSIRPCECKLSISGIEVYDSDNDVDFVRVEVTTMQGILGLNRENLALTDFTSCSTRLHSDWKCAGSGSGDSKMTFLAAPSDITSILSNMTYESVLDGRDTLNITIYDGAGGDCLTIQEHETLNGDSLNVQTNGYIPVSSIRNECFVVSKSLPIHVVPFYGISGNRKSIRNLPLHAWVGLIGTSFVMFKIFLWMCRATRSKT